MDQPVRPRFKGEFITITPPLVLPVIIFIRFIQTVFANQSFHRRTSVYITCFRKPVLKAHILAHKAEEVLPRAGLKPPLVAVQRRS